jgi:hypothetical protein
MLAVVRSSEVDSSVGGLSRRAKRWLDIGWLRVAECIGRRSMMAGLG